jgi:small-conductance mechanosensitive channel
MTGLLAKGKVLFLGFVFGLFVVMGYVPIQAQEIPLLDSLNLSQPSTTATIESQESPGISEVPKSFPVTLDGVELWQISRPLGEITPQQRAKAQSEKIAAIAASQDIALEDIIVKPYPLPTGEELLIFAKDRYILVVQREDAEVLGTTRQQLAEKYINILRKAIDEYRQRRSLKNIFVSGAWILLATLLLFVTLYLINRFFAMSLIPLTRFDGLIGKRIGGMEVGKKSKALIIKFIRFTLNLSKIISYLVVVFFYITIILLLNPFSNDFALRFNEFVRINIGKILGSFFGYLPNLFVISLIAVIAYYVLKVSNILFEEIRDEVIRIPGFYSDWAEPTSRIFSVLIILMAIMIASPYLPGFDSPAAKGITLFAGLLFSLGSSGAISNIVSGILLIYTRAFRIGDFVEIQGIRGSVVENTLLVTRIRTYLNEVISIPNSQVLTSTINNKTIGIDGEHPGVVIKTTVTLGYDNSWRTVYETLCAAALKTEGILHEPSPYVLQTELGDFYVAYTLHAYTRNTSKFMNLYSSLHENIQDCCNEVGIEIMSPHYSTLRDGNHTTIPSNYLDSDYQAPGFRIEKS